MYAKDFREIARAALHGKWGVAIAVNFVAALLTGGGGGNSSSTVSSAAQSGELSSFLAHDLSVILMTVAVIMSLVALVIGGAVSMGSASFHLKLIDRKEARFGDLFSQLHRIGAGICMVLLQMLFVYLWSLLFIIPGIIAGYRYAMMPYLMAEYPELGALDAMNESKRLMKGNKWRLFCLEMSFFGWALLSVLSLGIGVLWLSPYIETSRAAFYREITQTWRRPEMEPQQPGRPTYIGPEF